MVPKEITMPPRKRSVTRPKPRALIDRDAEWAELARIWGSDRPELGIVVGRRRAGKSFLLGRFVAPHGGLYYQATKQTSREQLNVITRVLAQHFADPSLAYGSGLPDWRSVLEYLRAKADRGPLMVVLDEFPYLAEADPSLPSVIQAWWDHEATASRCKLILSGSYISAMRRLTEADQPLYGRRTTGLNVRPFTYREAAGFVPAYAARERLVTYALFGGLPGNLALLDRKATLIENVTRHLLAPTSRLFDDGERILDTFVADAAVHYSILRAIAGGEHTFSKIANRVGKQTSSISRPLAWLEEMDLITKTVPITEGASPNPKLIRYRVADPYVAFWHRFVLPIRAMGVVDLLTQTEVWHVHIQPGLSDYIGGVFEEACRTWAGLDGGRQLPFRPVRVGEWWTPTSDHQVDVVALGPERQLLAGECKWGRVTADDIRTLRERAAMIAGELGGVDSVTLAVFEGAPSTGRARVGGDEVLRFSVDDLYR
jgi:hypothetical protein